MLNKQIKASDTEVVIFTSQEYEGDIEAFLDAVNSWLKSQPSNTAIEDIVYQHCGVTSRGKDIFSMAIISGSMLSTDKKS